jgi:hypothetical protein
MHTVISTWTDIIQQFFPIFTAPGTEIFSCLMTGWIMCTARRTITGILPFADPFFQHAHDAYHRFFPDSRCDTSKLWQILTLHLVKLFCPTGVITLALDDTLFHHSGRKINGAGYWRDAVRSTKKSIVYAWGLNLFFLTLQIRPPCGVEPFGFPVNMKLHRKNADTLIELAMQMVNQLHHWLPERQFRLVADGFYATLAGKQMPQTKLVSRIKCNAKIFALPPKIRKKRPGRPRKKGKRLGNPQKMTSYIHDWQQIEFCQRGKTIKRLVYTRQVIWYWVSHQPILLVISRDPAGKERDDFLFTTDLTMTAVEVLECYNDRWAIEDTFKNTKQFLGGQQPQTYKGQGPERAAALSLCLYSMVWLWYLRQKTRARSFWVQPWYRQKVTPSFVDALCCLRRELWTKRIKYMFGNSAVHDKKFEFLLEALAPAA